MGVPGCWNQETWKLIWPADTKINGSVSLSSSSVVWPNVIGSGRVPDGICVLPASPVPYSDASIPGAMPLILPALLTIPPLGKVGAGPMLKFAGAEGPPAELKAATEARPPTAMSLAGIRAMRCRESFTMVGTLVPFQSTVVPTAKFDPDTVKVKAPLSAGAELGDREEITGAGEAELSGSAMLHMLRPCVPAYRMRFCRSKVSERTAERGSPLPPACLRARSALRSIHAAITVLAVQGQARWKIDQQPNG